MRRIRHLALLVVLLLVLLVPTAALAPAAYADCPGNLLANPSFEDGKYKGEQVGTSLSSWMSVGWLPWAILGDAQINREIEFFVVDAENLHEGYYRVHHGRYAQKFFSGYSTHHAGFYQRVAVPRGSKVTFSIWAQIVTGQEEFTSQERPISDLKAPGNYRVWAGIDPFGDTPPGFGAPPSENTVWSPPVMDRETRAFDADGHEIDAWVLLTVSTIAQSDHVTVFTQGQPEFRVKNNSSFWDDACLVVEAPPTNTPAPTPIPTETPVATETPGPTATAIPPTETPAPTETPVPTQTTAPTAAPVPTDTPVPTATALPPTATPLPQPTATSPATQADSTPTLGPTAPEREPASGSNPGVYLIYLGAGLLGGVVLTAIVMRLRRRP